LRAESDNKITIFDNGLLPDFDRYFKAPETAAPEPNPYFFWMQ